MAINLQTPILNTRTRSVNFFNGRLLTGEDLTAEQQANRVAHNLLGQAAGSGVVYGLEVKESVLSSSVPTPVLAVSKGLAFNRVGAALLLADDTEISLVRPATASNGSTSLFPERRLRRGRGRVSADGRPGQRRARAGRGQRDQHGCGSL
jgi:hypothetical protein